MNTEVKINHIGKKISRIRELRGVKQDILALELGISQQMVSKIEQSEVLEDELLERVSKALGVTVDGIKNFSEEAVFNYFNTFNDNSGSGAFFSSTNLHCTFNPIDKLVEGMEENKRLYERLLVAEHEKIELLNNTIETLNSLLKTFKK